MPKTGDIWISTGEPYRPVTVVMVLYHTCRGVALRLTQVALVSLEGI